MTPAAPPFLPDLFRLPPRPAKRPATTWWLAPYRHASESWHLVTGNTAQDPSLRWGDARVLH